MGNADASLGSSCCRGFSIRAPSGCCTWKSAAPQPHTAQCSASFQQPSCAPLISLLHSFSAYYLDSGQSYVLEVVVGFFPCFWLQKLFKL